jgi:hypothetical protein
MCHVFYYPGGDVDTAVLPSSWLKTGWENCSKFSQVVWATVLLSDILGHIVM